MRIPHDDPTRDWTDYRYCNIEHLNNNTAFCQAEYSVMLLATIHGMNNIELCAIVSSFEVKSKFYNLKKYIFYNSVKYVFY
jgi:hypothetical protein